MSAGLHISGVSTQARVKTLTALVVGTDEWAIAQTGAALADGGHSVLRCYEPGEAPFPCNALREGRTCPLDVGFDVVVTARARAAAAPTLSEIGAVCALHAGAPLVVSGISEGDPFQLWETSAVPAGGDVVTACEEVVEQRRTREVISIVEPRRPADDVTLVDGSE